VQRATFAHGKNRAREIFSEIFSVRESMRVCASVRVESTTMRSGARSLALRARRRNRREFPMFSAR